MGELVYSMVTILQGADMGGQLAGNVYLKNNNSHPGGQLTLLMVNRVVIALCMRSSLLTLVPKRGGFVYSMNKKQNYKLQ